jgi:copper chaperone CopZ
MFNLFKKKPVGTTITLKLNGLHCSSCSLNIDSELEDIPGVIETNTSYAKQESVITYNPDLVSPAKFISAIESLGYKVI